MNKGSSTKKRTKKTIKKRKPMKSHTFVFTDKEFLELYPPQKYGHETPTQDAIYEFIKKYPNCSRHDMYNKLSYSEGDIRKTITAMLKSSKLKETFTIR